jgi:hypothetical protein
MARPEIASARAIHSQGWGLEGLVRHVVGSFSNVLQETVKNEAHFSIQNRKWTRSVFRLDMTRHTESRFPACGKDSFHLSCARDNIPPTRPLTRYFRQNLRRNLRTSSQIDADLLRCRMQMRGGNRCPMSAFSSED